MTRMCNCWQLLTGTFPPFRFLRLYWHDATFTSKAFLYRNDRIICCISLSHTRLPTIQFRQVMSADEFPIKHMTSVPHVDYNVFNACLTAVSLLTRGRTQRVPPWASGQYRGRERSDHVCIQESTMEGDLVCACFYFWHCRIIGA
jgi:hypothetical protein